MSKLWEDFYITPPRLIAKMIEGLNLGEMESVLDACAGRADIADYLKENQPDDRWFDRTLDIDVVEINPDLQHILRGKRYHLVHDDFLTFETQKAYDLIIANFPFSDGDQHLRQALTLLQENGGHLRCLVNAETIRNPYTDLRRVVVNTLERLGAEIEYLPGEFLGADRPTDVEVALIKLHVETGYGVSVILDTLRKAEEAREDPHVNQAGRQLIDRDFKRAFVARFNFECKLGLSLLDEYGALAEHLTDAIKLPGQECYPKPLIKLEVEGGRSTMRSARNQYLRGVRHKYWEVLIHDARFNGAYTSNILKDLSDKLEALRDYDFNLFNIAELEKELAAKITQGVEESILSLFNEFSRKYAWDESINEGNVHYYNGWKRNKAHKVNRRIIIPLHGFSAYSTKLDYSAHERLRDMVKVFNYLSDDKADVPLLVGAACNEADARRNYNGIDLRHFSINIYKKGTAHITFKDQRLLDKFNIFGSQRKAWLPPSYGRRPYEEMDAEERAVVDEFQGRAEYERVVQNPAFYLVDSSQLLLSASTL